MFDSLFDCLFDCLIVCLFVCLFDRASFQNISNHPTNTQPIIINLTHPQSISTLFFFYYNIFINFILLTFFISIINEFTSYLQLTYDQTESNQLRNRLPHNIRNNITSPNSGRLILPPPSTKKKIIKKKKKSIENGLNDLKKQIFLETPEKS